jgi:hypothetical protein
VRPDQARDDEERPVHQALQGGRLDPRQVLGGLHAAVACSLRRYNAHAIDIS